MNTHVSSRVAKKIVYDPQDDSVVGEVACFTINEARAAMDRAVLARPAMQCLSAFDRSTILEKAAITLADDGENRARLIAREGVKTINEARNEVSRAVNTLRLSAQAAIDIHGETIPFNAHPNGAHRYGWWTPEPIGVVLAITPFNDPLNLVAHKLGPAIAAGCPILLKPHEATPLSALALADDLYKAGLPPGALEVVTGDGATLGPPLVSDARTALVSFTGGLNTGRAIASTAGLTRLTMELGSNCSTIIMEDANLDKAAEACLSGMIAAAGQNCLHVQRIVVCRNIAEQLRERLVAGLTSVQLGSKLNEATDMGCMISSYASLRVSTMIKNAIVNGARVLIGGSHVGTHMPPVLLDRVHKDDPIRQKEVFGPVTALIEVDNFDEAIAVSNETPFGLQAAIFTSNLAHAHAAVKHLDAGTILINESTDYRLDAMPFGGTRNSGIGREGVSQMVKSLMEPKVACFTELRPH